MTPCVPHAATDCATCGVARVRRALALAPKAPTRTDDDPRHAPARDRARAERANRKETKP